MNTVSDDALASLLRALQLASYSFIAVTPATHERMIARRESEEAKDLRDVFGWSMPFREAALPVELLHLLRLAGAVEDLGGGLSKSRIRVSSLGERLFLHSAFPTDEEQSVFFGPDTYRFSSFIEVEMPKIQSARRIVDIGTGSGAGGIVAAGSAPEARLTLSDVNPAALRLASANAAHAGIDADIAEGANLDAVSGMIDLVLANPPYMIDESDRTYRDGGDMHGAALSLEWALAAARRLEPGGHMLLYTGVAIIEGRDLLREALERDLPAFNCSLRYRELDPDVFGEELENPAYWNVERLAAVGAVITRQ